MTNHEIMKEIEKRIEKHKEKQKKLEHSYDGSHTSYEWDNINRNEGYCDALIDIYNLLGNNLKLD